VRSKERGSEGGKQKQGWEEGGGNEDPNHRMVGTKKKESAVEAADSKALAALHWYPAEAP